MTWTLDPDATSLEFEARRLGLLSTQGRFDRFAVAIRPDTANPDRWGIDLQVAAASIFTANPRRDSRLAEPAYLDAAKYPEIAFLTRRVEPLHDIEESLSRVTGDLTIRGVTQQAVWEFELLARAVGSTGTLGANYLGRLTFDPRKWGLGTGSLILRPTVTVTLKLLVLANELDRGTRRDTPSNPPSIP
jgi:polyisoprenoid-binding protein YceI